MMQTNRPKRRLQGKKQRLWLEPENLKGRQICRLHLPKMQAAWRRTLNTTALGWRIVSGRIRRRKLMTQLNRMTTLAEWL